MKTRAQEIVDQIEKYQTGFFFHPLTCGNDACRGMPDEGILYGKIIDDETVVLACRHCDYTQERWPVLPSEEQMEEWTGGLYEYSKTK